MTELQTDSELSWRQRVLRLAAGAIAGAGLTLVAAAVWAIGAKERGEAMLAGRAEPRLGGWDFLLIPALPVVVGVVLMFRPRTRLVGIGVVLGACIIFL